MYLLSVHFGIGRESNGVVFEGLISLHSPINIVHYARATLFAFFFLHFPVLASGYETDLVMLNTFYSVSARKDDMGWSFATCSLPSYLLPLPTQLYSHSKQPVMLSYYLILHNLSFSNPNYLTIFPRSRQV